MTLPDRILEVLSDGRPRATHEISEAIRLKYGEFHNDASISARTREMDHLLEGCFLPGKRYKVWKIREQMEMAV